METNKSIEPERTKESRWVRRGKRLLFGFVCFVTLVTLWHAEENWRGKQAWNEYQKELVAEGEKFDAASYIPPKVPDDQNFAMTPFLAPMFDFFPGTQKQRDTNGVNRIYAFGNVPSSFNRDKVTVPWQIGQTTDFAAWIKDWQKEVSKTNKDLQVIPDGANLKDRQEAARIVLQLLKPNESVIEEFRASSQRPYARFNIAYDTPDKFSILLPHLAVMKRTGQILQLRSSAELALGQTDEAFKDIQLMFYLSDAIKDEPMLISHLVRIVILNIGLQSVWEGLADHRWSETQLEQWEKHIQGMNLINEYVRGIRGERDVLGSSFFEELRTENRRLGLMNRLSVAGGPSFGPEPNWFFEIAFRLAIPTGWSYFEQINCHRLVTKQQLKSIDVATQTVNPTSMEKNWKEVGQFLKGGVMDSIFHHKVMAKMLTPSLSNITKKSAFSQNALDMVRVACALERYYLAKKEYPANLEALVPQFATELPHDVIGGRPLKYRRNDDGRFVLYSVGWNETDDGGHVAMETKKNTSQSSGNYLDDIARRLKPDILEGDWVWQYSAVK